VLLVKHSRVSRRVALARSANVAAAMLPNEWMRLLTRCWKVVSLLIEGVDVKRLAVVVSRLKFREQLLLVGTVVRLDLRLLRARLSDRLVAVGLVLMLVKRVPRDVNVPQRLLDLKRLLLMTIGRAVSVVVRQLKKTLGLMLLSVKIDPALIRVM
jgi:hypothetical protein